MSGACCNCSTLMLKDPLLLQRLKVLWEGGGFLCEKERNAKIIYLAFGGSGLLAMGDWIIQSSERGFCHGDPCLHGNFPS